MTEPASQSVEMVTKDGTTTESLNQPNGHNGSTEQSPDPSTGQLVSQLSKQHSMKQGNVNMQAYQKLHSSLWKDLPNLTITYQDLQYQHLVPADDGNIPGLDKSFISFFLLKKWTIKPQVFTALHQSTGMVRPGTMTLILSPPGHGKSVLLKALAGRLNTDSRMTGTVKFNGLTPAEAHTQGLNIHRMTAYVDQGEAHNALMTVRETFQFALDNAVADPALLQSAEFVQASAQKVDYMIDLLGLREAAETILGNAIVRGVSGGQKRRVSIGEMIITDARALFLDEITTGLDSSASFDILNSLRKWTRSMNGSVTTALLQPTPECFNLFDRLVLVRHGTIVYDGPRESLNEYFYSIGIPVPDDQDFADFISDFLTDPSMVYYRTLYRATRRAGQDLASPSVTDAAANNSTNQAALGGAPSPAAAGHSIDELKKDHAINISSGELDSQTADQAQEQSSAQVSHSNLQETLNLAKLVPSPPLSTSALKTAWLSSKFYQSNLKDISAFESNPQVQAVSQWSEYTKAQFGAAHPRTYWDHLKFNFRRSAEDMKRNVGFFMPRIFQAIFIGFILGGLFYQTKPNDYQAKLGLIIFTVVNIAFANASEIPFAAEGKNVVFKQVDSGFYPTSSYVLSVIVTNLPVSIIESLIMVSIIYFMVGFALDAGRFFFFLLMAWTIDIALSVVFRAVTWATKNADVANQIAPPVVATMFLSAGYLILYNSFPRWLIWLYELSPFTWALRSIGINEFYDERYSGPSFIPEYQGMTIGEAYLRSWDIDPTWAYKWAGFGYVLGFFFIIAALSAVILSKTRYPLTVGTRRFADEEEAEAIAEDAQNRLDAATQNVTPATAPNGEQSTVTVQPALDAQHRDRAVASALKYASSFKLQTAATALPFIPVDLAWKDIHYSVTVKSEGKKVQRKLLAGIDGFATAGTLTALMGSSGAGKTTLMDVIAGRKTAGAIEGQILVNGYPKQTATFNRLCGYVEQTDNHNPALTVRESLAFSAKLRLSRTVTDEQRQKFVEEILDILELKPIADRIVGDDVNPGLSPGQLKRVTIGVELASNPSVLFLDEPTSGLDSRAALIVMRVVKRIAKTGRSVLCTIHQPSQELFFLFDRLLLLKSGGQTVYFGNVGQDGEELVSYFENSPVPDGARKPHRPPTTNPASWMLDVIGAGTAGQGQRVQADYLQIYANSPLKQTALRELEPLLKPNPSRPELQFDSMYATSYMTQYIELQKRVFTSYWRNPSFVWIRQGLMVFLASLLGFLYLQLGDGSAQSIITKFSAIFVGIAFPGWTVMSSALALFMRWRTVYYREQSSRMYSPSAYALATTVTEIFYTCWSAITFLALYYPMVGFPNNADSFFRYFFVQYLIMFVWISLGHLVAAALPNIMVGNIIASLVGTFTLLFSGVFRVAYSMPMGWKWIYYINWIPKALIPLSVVVFECTDDCTVLRNQYGPDGTDWGTLTSYQYVLNYLGAGAEYWMWIGYLFLTIVVMRMFFFWCVAKVSYLER